MVEINYEEQNRLKIMKKTEDCLRDLWENIKCTIIRIIGVPEKKRKKKGYEKNWKFPQHGNGNSQVQEAQRVPYRINPR